MMMDQKLFCKQTNLCSDKIINLYLGTLEKDGMMKLKALPTKTVALSFFSLL